MNRRFVLTPEAKDDIKQILLDIAEDSPNTAERIRTEFHDALLALAKSPGIGRYHDEAPQPEVPVLELLLLRCRLRLEAKPIQVIAIVHGARDLAVFLTLRAGHGG